MARAESPMRFGTNARANSSIVAIRSRFARLLACSMVSLGAFITPPQALARDWPQWPGKNKKKPDVVTAACTLDRNQVEPGSAAVLHAKIVATESRGHTLSYVWSGNGGKIDGVGQAVTVDVSGLNSGAYQVTAAAHDAYQNSASCTAEFQVLPPPDSVSMFCSAVDAVVEQGKTAIINAEGKDALAHPLHYKWFTNGGSLHGEGAQVMLDTAEASAGTYTITGRVEDDAGRAADCTTMITVEAPPPPPPPAVPPQLANIAEIVFLRNQDWIDDKSQAQLERVLSRMLAEPDGRVSIESYAGPDEKTPAKLAAGRAESVKRYLLQNGIADSRVQTMVGQGGKRGGLRNRTLDIIWLPKGVEY